MICKSISHHKNSSASYIIKYIFSEDKELEGSDSRPLILKQFVRGYDKEQWIAQFLELENKRKTKKHHKSITAYHEVISFSPKSTPYLMENREVIKDLIQEYIRLRGNKQLCVSAIHFDEHIHAHLCFSGIRRDTYTSARLSKAQFACIKQELQGYQIKKYPQLNDSIVLHGQKKHSQKQKYTDLIQQLFEKSNSISELVSYLKEHNIDCYYRNGVLSGVLVGGRKHRFKKLSIDLEPLHLKDTIHKRYKELSENKKGYKRTKDR